MAVPPRSQGSKLRLAVVKLSCCAWMLALAGLAGCSHPSSHADGAPPISVDAFPLPVLSGASVPSITPPPTPFALDVRLTTHALCEAPWSANGLEGACPRLIALYPAPSELAALSTLPADQWPVYPVRVLAYDPETGCIYVREADGTLGWTSLSAVQDPAQIELITRAAPVWQG